MTTNASAGGFSSSDAYVAAQMYYEQGLSQVDVADRLGTSRPSVSRMLSFAREQGIVEIIVRPPADGVVLENDIARLLKLSRASVVDVDGRRIPHESVAHATRLELARLNLKPGNVLGMSWGDMMGRVAGAGPSLDLRGVQVIPVVGAMDEMERRFQSNEIAREFAARHGASVVFVTAPVAPTPLLAQALRTDVDYGRRFALWDRLDAAVVGIGGAPSAEPQLPAHMEWARSETDAVGDVAGRLFRIDGSAVIGKPDEELIAISREQLVKTPHVIGAATGSGKVLAIIGAARAGLIRSLVTDRPTARAVLQELGTMSA